MHEITLQVILTIDSLALGAAVVQVYTLNVNILRRIFTHFVLDRWNFDCIYLR